MRLPIFQVDAFTDRPFAGNPATVVPLTAWLPEGLMQQIAAGIGRDSLREKIGAAVRATAWGNAGA